jgi:hypothetical protein
VKNDDLRRGTEAGWDKKGGQGRED